MCATCQENPHELDILFKELLISVTNFFRDPRGLRRAGSTGCVAWSRSRPDNYTLRIWVPGCATGEEAFAGDRIARMRGGPQSGIWTYRSSARIWTEAIESARNGQFPDGIAVDVLPQRLERHFVRDDSTFRIRKEIREMVVFAVQNVIKDPPFTKLDIISCRNLLIYLNADLQRRLLPIFHYALKPGGLCFSARRRRSAASPTCSSRWTRSGRSSGAWRDRGRLCTAGDPRPTGRSEAA